MLPFTIENQLTIGDYTNILLKKTYKRPAFIFLSAIGLFTLIIHILYRFEGQGKTLIDFLPWPFVSFPIVLPLLAVYKARALYKASKRTVWCPVYFLGRHPACRSRRFGMDL